MRRRGRAPYMAYLLRSATLTGIDATEVRVQIDSAPGLFSLSIVGLPDKAVQESASRIGSAIKNSGFTPPSARNKRFTVNLAPADIRKEGSGLDFPIALACLLETGQIQGDFADTLTVGELGLDGSLAHTNGIIAIAQLVKESGIRNVILPIQNAAEAACVEGIAVFGADCLASAVAHLTGAKPIQPTSAPSRQSVLPDDDSFIHIRGQESAKRALIVAAAGGHNILMHGPPGTGKTLLARSLIGLIPPLSAQEAVEVAKIQSSLGLLRGPIFGISRPFCAPHHTASSVAIIGGGTSIRPGQISLAHRGVLFLDEFPEFARNVLEALRQPLEDGVVTVSRASGSAVLPAKFMLVAAMNPCPCGNLGDVRSLCSCSPQSIQKYVKRISGPLLDRMDIQVQVAREGISDDSSKADMRQIRSLVLRARERQLRRFAGTPLVTNAEISHRTIASYCSLDAVALRLLEDAASRHSLSMRSYHKIQKVARTIADMEDSERITVGHIAEAISLRIRERVSAF